MLEAVRVRAWIEDGLLPTSRLVSTDIIPGGLEESPSHSQPLSWCHRGLGKWLSMYSACWANLRTQVWIKKLSFGQGASLASKRTGIWSRWSESYPQNPSERSEPLLLRRREPWLPHVSSRHMHIIIFEKVRVIERLLPRTEERGRARSLPHHLCSVRQSASKQHGERIEDDTLCQPLGSSPMCTDGYMHLYTSALLSTYSHSAQTHVHTMMWWKKATMVIQDSGFYNLLKFHF